MSIAGTADLLKMAAQGPSQCLATDGLVSLTGPGLLQASGTRLLREV